VAMLHILFVEDDREIICLVSRYLCEHDCRVSTAGDGHSMDRAIADNQVDLVLLDLMLPGEDGLSLCRRLRSRSQVPVIILSAKGEDIDRIVGLEMGADDYLTKPFNPRELLARIRAVLRRAKTPAVCDSRRARTFVFEGWCLDRVARELTDPQGIRIALTGAEFDLLQVLCERPECVLSREQLFELTHGRSTGSLERSIDVLISRLRHKLERNPHAPHLIKTVRSGGYLFTAPVAVS
jgi:two-component system, OmpR family, response regulator